MKRFPIPRLERYRTHRRERGVTMMFIVIAIFALLGVAALAIDLVTIYVSKAEAQRVADSAALAGAKALVDAGITADPTNASATWAASCTRATDLAQGIANRGLIGGTAPATTTVCFTDGVSACSASCPAPGAAGSGFGVNPQVGVTVQSATLPLFFAKIWGQKTATVSAVSNAEGFNPSGTTVPVQVGCVTPWLLPNINPVGGAIIDTATGNIATPGTGPTGIFGNDIQLIVACMPSNCGNASRLLPSGNPPPIPPPTLPATLSYYPLNLGAPAASRPSCAGGFAYSQNITSCNRTSFQCGSTIPLAGLNPETSGTNIASIECLTNAGASGPGAGQDTLTTAVFPFTIQAGFENPLVALGTVATGDTISTSRSVVTLPIYNQGPAPPYPAPPNPAVVIGFAQAFVEQVSAGGRPTIRILNVSGCAPGATGAAVGDDQSSSVPVRLIHP